MNYSFVYQGRQARCPQELRHLSHWDDIWQSLSHPHQSRIWSAVCRSKKFYNWWTLSIFTHGTYFYTRYICCIDPWLMKQRLHDMAKKILHCLNFGSFHYNMSFIAGNHTRPGMDLLHELLFRCKKLHYCFIVIIYLASKSMATAFVIWTDTLPIIVSNSVPLRFVPWMATLFANIR